MKTLFIILGFSSIPFLLKAQQDLKDPSYIYYNDNDGSSGRAVADYMSIKNATAVLYRDSLYKKVDFGRMYLDSSLINYEITWFTKPEDILKYTDDCTIKVVYVVGKRKN